jgi:hypothetical protein
MCKKTQFSCLTLALQSNWNTFAFKWKESKGTPVEIKRNGKITEVPVVQLQL